MRVENANQASYGINLRQMGQVASADAVRRAYQAQAGARTDFVSISPQSRALLLARQRADELPEVREELVAKLREEIAAGSYRPSSQQVAVKMLAELGNIFRG